MLRASGVVFLRGGPLFCVPAKVVPECLVPFAAKTEPTRWRFVNQH